MSDILNTPGEDLQTLIQKIAYSDTVIFDTLQERKISDLEMCGKCGQCGQCGECVKNCDDMRKDEIENDIKVLRIRIKTNPEILKDIKNRWNVH